MKKILLVLTLFIATVSYALDIECVGNAQQLTHNGDTLFLFENNPEVKSKIGAIDWYRLPDTVHAVQNNTDYLYPEHGAGYMLKKGNLREYFWVFDYTQLRADVHAIEATPSCDNTVLTLTGAVPAMQYENRYGQSKTYPRQCSVSYMNAQWSKDSEQWVDSAVVEQVAFKDVITVGATPVATAFTIRDALLDSLGLVEDTLVSPVIEPIALKSNPLAVVTTRPNEKSNEVDRPVDPETLINRSAPLEVYFRSNALNSEYYKWDLYKGTDKILSRAEAEHRYTFMEPGAYRAVVAISNDDCQLDSVEFTINVSESMLAVPNTFTPNGDGVNDEFRVSYRSLKEFHCWVYNRWGHLVYQWTDPAKGWDGNIGGKPAAEGAYYYVIRALGTDAESDYISKPKYTKKVKKQEQLIGVYQLSGDINLLRGGK